MCKLVIESILQTNPPQSSNFRPQPKLLGTSTRQISRRLSEIQNYTVIKNPQSRYRKIFYSSQNDEVEANKHNQNGLSNKNLLNHSGVLLNHSGGPLNPNGLRTQSKEIDKTKGTERTEKKIKLYSPNSDEFGLAELLLDLILERKPDFKKPNLQSWAGHIGLMIRRDNRDPERIDTVIRWCQADSFWALLLAS